MSNTLNGRFRQAAALLLSSVLLWCSVPASARAAESIDPATDAMVQSYEDKLADLQRRQSVATEELIAITNEQGNAWDEKVKLDELINIVSEQKRLTESRIDTINRQIEEKQKSIAETTARIESQQSAFYERMVDNYTEKKADYLELVLGSQNLVEFLTKFDYVVNILDSDRKIITRLREDQDTLTQDQEILQAALETQVTAVSEYEREINQMRQLNVSMEEYIVQLQADQKRYEEYIAYTQQQTNEVQDTIKQTILAAQIEQQQRAEEARQRKAAEEEARRIAAEQEWKRQQAEAEAAAKRQKELEEEQARQEAEWKKQQEAEAEWKRQQEEAEAEWRRQQEEEEARRQRELEEQQNGSGWEIAFEENSEEGWNAGSYGYTDPGNDSWDSYGYEDENGTTSWDERNDGWDGRTASSGYDGDTSSEWGTGGEWTGDTSYSSGSNEWTPGEGYDGSYTADGSDSWSKIDYSESYKQYYEEGGYVGGQVSWVLEPGVEYKVSSEQGWRELYGEADYHLGTDLACSAGTEIRAYNAGKVLVSEYHSSYGNYVIVNHGGGLTTLYAHMSERAVSAGDWVESGQVLGYVGMTGSAYGYHLHFEVREDGEVVNPRNYLDF